MRLAYLQQEQSAQSSQQQQSPQQSQPGVGALRVSGEKEEGRGRARFVVRKNGAPKSRKSLGAAGLSPLVVSHSFRLLRGVRSWGAARSCLFASSSLGFQVFMDSCSRRVAG